MIQQVELHWHDTVAKGTRVQYPAALLPYVTIQCHSRPVRFLALAAHVET